jgi:hypothetical protein
MIKVSAKALHQYSQSIASVQPKHCISTAKALHQYSQTLHQYSQTLHQYVLQHISISV